jgi:hypothetical protein
MECASKKKKKQTYLCSVCRRGRAKTTSRLVCASQNSSQITSCAIKNTRVLVRAAGSINSLNSHVRIFLLHTSILLLLKLKDDHGMEFSSSFCKKYRFLAFMECACETMDESEDVLCAGVKTSTRVVAIFFLSNILSRDGMSTKRPSATGHMKDRSRAFPFGPQLIKHDVMSLL